MRTIIDLGLTGLAALGSSILAPSGPPSPSNRPLRSAKLEDGTFFNHWRYHPGRNLAYNARGRRWFERSRWKPHIGAKEAARHAAK